MSIRKLPLVVLAILLALGAVPRIGVADQPDAELAKREKQRAPRPDHFAIVFSFGYAGDNKLMPTEDDRFEELLKKIKEAGFNTIHCAHTDKRVELCHKHDIKMMVDLLAAPHHVYTNLEETEALCKKLRGNPDIWGYNIWNDPFGKQADGRKRDINNVRLWDPTHPAFCGTYRTGGMSHLTNGECIGYYDFAWKRGIDQHFPNLLQFRQWSEERNAIFYRWLETDAGAVGKGNYNRSLYSANTSIACGLKGIIWFLGTRLMNHDTLEWTAAGEDIAKVNKSIAPLGKELAALGIPTAVYSTAITKSSNNKDVGEDKKPAYPPGLDKNPIPKDFKFQAASGEFVVGVFKPSEKHEAFFFANNNAYAVQEVKLQVAAETKAELFDRKKAEWVALPVKDGVLSFQLEAGGGELVRLAK